MIFHKISSANATWEKSLPFILELFPLLHITTIFIPTKQLLHKNNLLAIETYIHKFLLFIKKKSVLFQIQRYSNSFYDNKKLRVKSHSIILYHTLSYLKQVFIHVSTCKSKTDKLDLVKIIYQLSLDGLLSLKRYILKNTGPLCKYSFVNLNTNCFI